MRKLLYFFLMAFLCSCGGGNHPTSSDSISTPPEADITNEAIKWADSIYNAMTVEERMAQMLMPAIYTRSDSISLGYVLRLARSPQVGGFLLLKGNAESAAAIADSLEEVRRRNPHSPGFYIAVDAETGLGMRFSDAPLFPWNSNIDKSADDETFFDYGREVGREARIAGINMILGPVVDVNRLEMSSPGVMKRRSLGSDQLRVAKLSVAYALGLQSLSVAGVLKHFPGHGPTSSDSHRSLPILDISRDEIFTVDLLPFRAAIENGVAAIMVGHIWAPALDSVRRPASFSPVVIDSLLRHDLSFNGLVLVDAVNMGGAKGFTGADAIMAGADIIIAPEDTARELQNLLDALSSGRLSEKRMEESCKRILIHKYLQGVNTSSRTQELGENDSAGDNIKERLYEEAPGIIDRLNGVSQ